MEPGAGEPQRQRLRALAEPWLDRAAWELVVELARRDPGADARLVTEIDPDARRRIYDERSKLLDGLVGLREEWADVRRDAAVRVGAADVTGLLGATHPVAPTAIAAGFGSHAIEPLDDAVGAATRERRRAWPIPLNDPPHPCDGWVLRSATGFLPDFDRVELKKTLVRTAAGLGRECRFDSAGDAPESVMVLDVERRPAVRLGVGGGPGSLSPALAALGQALRADFVRETRGVADWRFADPAFHAAAGVLFRRLALSAAFRTRYGPPLFEGWDRWLILEEALAPRRAWNYLFLVSCGRIDVVPTGADLDAAFRRTDGEPPSREDGLRLGHADPAPASALRGTVLGLLQEERLLCRYGYGWFESPGALRWLAEMWEAEPGETAESMARLADLGTIEETPVLDRCRPGIAIRR